MSAPNKLTEEERNTIYRLFVTGILCTELAEMYKVSPSTIEILVSDKLKKNRKRVLIDSELEKCAKIACNLGIDSTRKERLTEEWKQRAHIKNIKKIDNEFFVIIKPDND